MTIVHLKAIRISFATTPAVGAMLSRLAETGLWGRNTAEVVERLVARGLETETMADATYDYDVFVSYSAKDERTAKELTTLLAKQDLRCFLAEKSIRAGAQWKDEVRKALTKSRIAVIVVTPNSITSKWVISEAGAFWALGKPVAPALFFAGIEDLPDILKEYQCRTIETMGDRKEFAAEIAAFCNAFKPRSKPSKGRVRGRPV
jgi:hypothetical protein